VSIAQSLVLDKPIYAGNPATGALGQRLVQNTPTGQIQAPLLIAQGLADPLVLPSVQAQYVSQRCATGQNSTTSPTPPETMSAWSPPNHRSSPHSSPGRKTASPESQHPTIARQRDHGRRVCGRPVASRQCAKQLTACAPDNLSCGRTQNWHAGPPARPASVLGPSAVPAAWGAPSPCCAKPAAPLSTHYPAPHPAPVPAGPPVPGPGTARSANPPGDIPAPRPARCQASVPAAGKPMLHHSCQACFGCTGAAFAPCVRLQAARQHEHDCVPVLDAERCQLSGPPPPGARRGRAGSRPAARPDCRPARCGPSPRP
jgi:hypothetical protein